MMIIERITIEIVIKPEHKAHKAYKAYKVHLELMEPMAKMEPKAHQDLKAPSRS
jgi:hypothetical protein